MKEQNTYLLLPKGEWLTSLLSAFAAANMALETTSGSSRCYEYRFLRDLIPIVFLAVRSKEVPVDIEDPDNLAQGGFTGSDILAEGNLEADWEFPLAELEPSAPQPELYLGVTPRLGKSSQEFKLEDLVGKTIYTSYPNLTQLFLGEAGLAQSVKLKTRQGTIEGRWRSDPTNVAIVDISSSGMTRVENQIEVVAKLMKPKVVFYGQALSPTDQNRIDDLKERIYQAVSKKGVL